VGFASCKRLITEFLAIRPSDQKLLLIFTTRSASKGAATLQSLEDYTRKGHGKEIHRVLYRRELVDLTDLQDVKALAERLLDKNAEPGPPLPKLDAVILNAGMGGFTGIQWPYAIWTVLTDWIQATSWPKFKKQAVGVLAEPQKIAKQLSTGLGNKEDEKLILGQIFTANVFGHYLLAHWLVPLLSVCHGKIIWTSSLEANMDGEIDIDDIQGLKSPTSYEASKRLTDLLALSSWLEGAKPWVNKYLSSDLSPEQSNLAIAGDDESSSQFRQEQKISSRPKIYLTHPGIAATSIIPLPWILDMCMTFCFFVSRWLGGPWHTVSAYKAATAPVWVALQSDAEMEQAESITGKGRRPAKWGSAVDVYGNEKVLRTEVTGYGYGGVIGEKVGIQKGRKRGAVPLTQEARDEFETLGRDVWREMESMREFWEAQLSG
jgi:3-keto steroid reductase